MILFLKSQRKGASDVMDDLFGEPAPAPKTTKEVMHSGYTDKAGHYHAPHPQRHEVNVEHAPVASSHPWDSMDETARTGLLQSAHPAMSTSRGSASAQAKAAAKQAWADLPADIRDKIKDHHALRVQGEASPAMSAATASARPPATHTSSTGEPLWATPEPGVYTDADGTEVEDGYAVLVKPTILQAPAKRSGQAQVPAPAQAPEEPPARMKNYGWDAVKLADAYSMDELNTLRGQVEAEHRNPLDAKGHPTENGKSTIYLFDKKGRKKLDSLTWAVRYKMDDARQAASDVKQEPHDQGSQEGDTKTENGIAYTLRDGRWHRDTPDADGKLDSIASVVETATQPGRSGNKAYHVYRKVSEQEADQAQRDGGLSLAGYEHGIDEAAVRHALKQHGDETTEAKRGQAAITRADFAKIPEITDPDKADSIDYAHKTTDGLSAVLYKKRYNGTTYVVEEIRDRRRRLAFKTMWKTRHAPRAASDKEGAAHTSETFGRHLPNGKQSVGNAAPDGNASADDLDPSSPNYRYRDTGHVAGSRKEEAAKMLRQARRDGAQVRGTAIDWEVLEQNPREAKEVITKSHLFGAVDWDALKAGGMEPGAGFLVDRIYAAVGTAPTDDTPQARKDYTIGLESLRDRLERCKTPDDVTKVLAEIRDEWEGVNLNEAETAAYAALGEQRKKMAEPYYAAREQSDALSKDVSRLQSAVSALEYKRRRTPAEEQDMAVLKGQASAAWDKAAKFRADNPYFFDGKRRDLGGGWSSNDTDAEWDMRQLRNRQDAVVAAAKIRNAVESPVHRAWAQMGERFVNLLNYRKFKGSDSFAKHAANAKGGRIVDWSWAEKETKAAPRGASDESTRFQLLVADSYERQGGRAVHAESTDALKRAFGLREVQSGNWVLRDVNSAKFHTEQTAGALADLADLIGVPDRQIAMNGRLALAFGARGHGNTGLGGAARAHYEPVERVINLTKMGGGGSLAHEWLHALDNLLSESLGAAAGADTFLSEDPLRLPAGELRDAFIGLRSALIDGSHRVSRDMVYTGEDYRLAQRNIVRSSDYGMPVPAKLIRAAGNVHAAVQAVDTYFDGLKQTTKHVGLAKQWRTIAAAYHGGNPAGGVVSVASGPAMSDFAREAVLLDKGNHGKYWSSAKELAARAFQAWAEDRLADQGRRNDYLSAKADNKWYVSPFGSPKPFPEGPERERTNAAFDRLMGAISKGDLLAKALARVDGPRFLLFKSRGWFSPEHGGTHRKQAPQEDGEDLGGGGSAPTLPSSAHLATPAEARAYWRAHFGGKTMALTVHSGGKEYPIKVRFGAENDHAYTADVGGRQKTGIRGFDADRAHAMDRILSVIDRPKRRLRDWNADLLLEHRIGGHHYTVALTWESGDTYRFSSAHCKSIDDVARLFRRQNVRKNKGPLQKGGPFSAFPKLQAPYGCGIAPLGVTSAALGSGRTSSDCSDDCQDSIPPLTLFFKALPAGIGRRGKVCMTRAEFDAEHKRLLAVLRSPDHDDDLEEADEQEQEVADLKKAIPLVLFFKAQRPQGSQSAPGQDQAPSHGRQEAKARLKGG